MPTHYSISIKSASHPTALAAASFYGRHCANILAAWSSKIVHALGLRVHWLFACKVHICMVNFLRPSIWRAQSWPIETKVHYNKQYDCRIIVLDGASILTALLAELHVRPTGLQLQIQIIALLACLDEMLCLMPSWAAGIKYLTRARRALHVLHSSWSMQSGIRVNVYELQVPSRCAPPLRCHQAQRTMRHSTNSSLLAVVIRQLRCSLSWKKSDSSLLLSSSKNLWMLELEEQKA